MKHAITDAYLHSHNALQKLTFILEHHGIITEPELAYIWGERETNPTTEATNEEASSSLRAAVPQGRAVCECACAHGVITDENSPGITRENGRASDSQSGGAL